MYLKYPHLLPRLAFAFLLVFLFILESCTDNEVTPVPDPVTDPSGLPSKSCSELLADGYTDKLSYLPGEKMKVYLSGMQAALICRLTAYTVHGDSAFSIATSLPVQSIVGNNPSSDGYGYSVTAEVEVPSLPSGVYLFNRSIPFIIKSTRPVDILVVYASNTANAYCESGGKSLYSRENRPSEVSFHRPIALEAYSQPCLSWFTQLPGITFGYAADSDLDQPPVFNAKVVAIVGHSEYWTRAARLNFDSFVDAGGHALILSGNTMWWQVRYSSDGSKLICYKSESDPIDDPLLKTINWNQKSLQYSIIHSIGAEFPNGGYGSQVDAGWDGYKVVLPASPLLEGTGLKKGDIIRVPTVEYDGAPLKGFESDGTPIIKTDTLNFNKIELLGFDKGFRVKETFGTFIVMKRKPTSGIIINTASMNWCSFTGMGGQSGDVIKKITFNALTKLLHDQPVFTP